MSGLRQFLQFLVFVFVLVTISMHPSLVFAFAFPEESNRSVWDRGCVDWPESIPGQGSGAAEKNPSIFIEKGDGLFRVLSKMTLFPQKGEDFTAFTMEIHRLILDAHPYPQWVLPGINEKPDGGSYFVSVDGLVVAEREVAKHYLLTGPYTFKLLWFKRSGTTTMELRHDQVMAPDCPLFNQWRKNNSTSHIEKAVFRMTPRPDLVQLMMSELYLLPNPKERKIELRMRLVAKPSSFVYQLLSESMMRSQVEVRGTRIFQNLLDVKRVLVAPKISTVSDPATSTKARSPKQAR